MVGCLINAELINQESDYWLIPSLSSISMEMGKKEQKTLLSSTEDKIHGTFCSVTYVLESIPFESFLSTF